MLVRSWQAHLKNLIGRNRAGDGMILFLLGVVVFVLVVVVFGVVLLFCTWCWLYL